MQPDAAATARHQPRLGAVTPSTRPRADDWIDSLFVELGGSGQGQSRERRPSNIEPSPPRHYPPPASHQHNQFYAAGAWPAGNCAAQRIIYRPPARPCSCFASRVNVYWVIRHEMQVMLFPVTTSWLAVPRKQYQNPDKQRQE